MYIPNPREREKSQVYIISRGGIPGRLYIHHILLSKRVKGDYKYLDADGKKKQKKMDKKKSKFITKLVEKEKEKKY